MPLQSRQKPGGFPSLGTPHVHASGDTWTIILVASPHEPAVGFPARDGKVGSERDTSKQGGNDLATTWERTGNTPVALPARDGFQSASTPSKSVARMRLRKAFHDHFLRRSAPV